MTKKADKEKNEEVKEEAKQESLVTLTPEEQEALLARIKELEGMKDKMLRAAADFENAKKRLTKERDEFARFAQERIVKDLLPIIDNLERSLAHANDKDAKDGFVTGIQMILKQFSESLKNHGLQRMETVGKVFDPHFHESIGFVQEEGKEDEIVEEIEPGYMLHDKLLRAAKVKVRMAPAAPKNEESESESKSEDEIT